MYYNKTFLAIIPARGGSKGIYKKNIVKIKGKPLIQYTIDEAKKSKYLDRVIVSTEDEEISRISRTIGAEVPFLRPKYLAQDKSKVIDSIIYTINKFEENGFKYDYVVLLQPTQPLRLAYHIDEAIEKIVKKNEDSLVSISEVKEHPILMRTLDENERTISLLNVNSTVRRQEFPKMYKVNGAIYINKINSNLNKDTSMNDNILAYIMEKEYDLDIDDAIDLQMFKLNLEK
ncbi:acylneuraminate cytidylyltransferase family protein [Hathewaya histolytica]|uniref:Acylneuraminate cytidylyltransferase n=1 Tax=Hathewaya histolytica TaxID=1498 RepID=A0A4U9R7M1_HATHI|nr:acylneuraminate cytidylyltransferase family protein [Hathewaya histolytica]VTQ87269.1 acylneuraminate cytidylyltransferase [Hathewaya histolytica]